MADALWLQTTRVGQITGSTGGTWPRPVDAEGWPLLTDTTRWGVVGADLGANGEHVDGRLWFFFGDVATHQRPGDPPLNADFVAWTDDTDVLEHGGHLPIGLEFVLPFAPTGIGGQDEWRFCLKCAALFWNGDPQFKGRCAAGGHHNHFGVGLNFVIPFEPTPEPGQPEWRFCINCGAMFWDGDRTFSGHCPGGGVHQAAGFGFVMRIAPQAPAPAIEGQPIWRFCANCHGLFWDGYPQKGVCAGAPGGGIRLHAVLRYDGQFDPFRGPLPIGATESYETPNGAFTHAGRMYVFAGISDERWSGVRRPAHPACGLYLFSKADPLVPGPYDVEFLFSPRMGWCALDASRTAFASHQVLGFQFVLPHDLPPSFEGRERAWRSCRHCDALFWDGDPAFKGVCQRGGGAHEPDPAQPADYALEFGLPEDAQHQANWQRCRGCLALFWNGEAPISGLCPALGQHEPDGANLRLPFITLEEDGHQQRRWRFCRKCMALFFAGYDPAAGFCPRDGGRHEAQGLEFVIPHDTPETANGQTSWRFCDKCSGMYFEPFTDQSRCPFDGDVHRSAGFVFTLPHDLPDTVDRQRQWRFCTKCTGLFFDGFADKGCCPRDGLGHSAAGIEFGLAHNPGLDGHNHGQWQFCTRCREMVRTDQETPFAWLAPVRVANAEHEVLHANSTTGTGLVIIGFDGKRFRLGWMALVDGQPPRFDSARYYHKGRGEWTDSPDSSAGYELFSHAFPDSFSYTHVSAAWLPTLGLWVVLYATAWDEARRFVDPIVARFSRNLIDWTDPVPIFDPGIQGAYGRYMHQPPLDRIHPDLPPRQPNGKDNPGWAYGAFLLERFTAFDRATGVLRMAYLLSFGSPYQVHVMHSTVSFPTRVAPLRLAHCGSGSGTSDSHLAAGTFYGLSRSGDLHWYRYDGSDHRGPTILRGWHPNSGNIIRRGLNVRHVLGCGNEVILTVEANGDLVWHAYGGGGDEDVTGTNGWHPNSGNPIGNGWNGFRHLVVLAQRREPSRPIRVLAVDLADDLRWYAYAGEGESDISGASGWHPNSRNRIGNGWNFLRLHGSGDVLFAVDAAGDLRWYRYQGEGEDDVTGATGWHPNSSNRIGNGWQGFRTLFGGPAEPDGRGHVIYALTDTGDLLWYRYDGEGEDDVTGATGWHPDSGTVIRRGW